MNFFAKLKDLLPAIVFEQGVDYLDNFIVYILTKMPVEKKQELGSIAARWFVELSDRVLGEEGSENIEQAVQDTFDDIVIGVHREFDKDDKV